MQAFDFTSDDPYENLALDEVLLRSAEQADDEDTLRFWESPIPFVVLGLAQRIHDEVRLEACAEDGVPVTRRCSAGGCVLQGPGCLNFTLVLAKDRHPGIETIRGSYDFILGKIAAAMGADTVVSAGISDLAVDGRKVSGNAQRRQKRFILHHGTLLYDADIYSVKRYLNEPEDRPEYRGRRSHDDFITNLDLPRERLVSGILGQFGANECVEPDPGLIQQSRQLAEEKYRTEAWIYRK